MFLTCCDKGLLDYNSSSDAAPATISAQSPDMNCILLNIIDDAIFESSESFLILLSAMTFGVILTQDEINITIIDNDGMVMWYHTKLHE